MINHLAEHRPLTQMEARLLSYVQANNDRPVSYDRMALDIDYDRRSLVSAMQRLCHLGYVRIVERGRGCKPHRYRVINMS